MRPVLQGKKQTKETTISINHCIFDYTRYKSNPSIYKIRCFNREKSNE